MELAAAKFEKLLQVFTAVCLGSTKAAAAASEWLQYEGVGLSFQHRQLHAASAGGGFAVGAGSSKRCRTSAREYIRCVYRAVVAWQQQQLQPQQQWVVELRFLG
jgi:hypothetical protein